MKDIPRACVVGWPAKHSRSPLIHSTWLAEYAIEGHYGIEEVEPGNFAGFLTSLGARGYVGCNVTVPHKEAVPTLVQGIDEATRTLGAANTVWYEDGRLVAANTDVEGFLTNLDEGACGWDEGLARAAILGAGGAARGLVYALLSRGVPSIAVINRSRERAEALARDFGAAVKPLSWAEMDRGLEDAGLLVNATSLGMAGGPPLRIDLAPLARDAVVNDIVYVPLETPLLAEARAHGLRTVDGLGMLLHQAVPGFERWFGVRPAVTPELRRRVVADLEGR